MTKALPIALAALLAFTAGALTAPHLIAAKPSPTALSIKFANNREGIELSSALLWEAKENGECLAVTMLEGDALPIWLHSC